MTSCIPGTRSRRAAIVRLLCAWAIVAQAGPSFAQEMVVPDQFNSSDAVISDGAMLPGPSDGTMLQAPGNASMPSEYSSGDYNPGDYGSYDAANYYGGGYCGGDNCGSSCNGNMPCDNCPPCQPPCNHHRCCSGWFGVEYLNWRLEGNRLPPLITAGPSNQPLTDVAQLDDPNTEILVGREAVNDEWRDGLRFFGGFWFDCCHTCGIGADYFELGDDDFVFTSPQDPSIIVGRPFFNTETGLDDVELVSVPNELDGTATVRSTDDFKGAGLTINRCLWRCCDPCCPDSASGLTLLSGYRYYKYESNLSITEALTILPGTTTPLVPGTTIDLQDSFRTRNEFNGGEIGMQCYKKHCCWWIDGMAKLALGSQRRTVTVDGDTFVDVPGGGTAVSDGGLLTSEITNIGRFRDSDFVVIPEFRVGVGAMITCHCSVRGGYNLIYWGDVARAASHLPPDLEVDPRNLPPIQPGGGPEPIFPGIRGSELVVHGIDASVQVQW
jgi:Putative beta barrel porin-7 (BBP7)